MKNYTITLQGKEINITQNEDGTFNKPDFILELEKQGTATKPAHEPICMARKPLSEKTIVENVLKYGTGAIDIDGCRIHIQDLLNEPEHRPNAINHITNKGENSIFNHGGISASDNGYHNLGRFPANIICTDDALNDGVIQKSTNNGGEVFRRTESSAVNTKGMNTIGKSMGERNGFNDIGSKSRYFNIDVWGEKHGLLQFPKASKRDRGDGNTHPTVKPTHLMAWLIKLVSKDGDIILDPFTGSGTTLVAAKTLNRNYIGFEITSEYEEIANKRLDNIIDLQPKLF